MLERAYGPLGECEFLPGESFASDRVHADRADFFRALGVTDSPRPVRLGSSPGHANHFDAWRDLHVVRAAADCGNEHPRAERQVRGEVIDRLDELLDRAELRGSAALVDLLASLRAPFGPPADLRCMHYEHRGKAKWKQTVGYQRWRITTASWVPVTSDPLLRKSLPPTAVWTGAPTSRKHPVLVPRLRAAKSARRLAFVAWSRPSSDAIIAALEDLHAGFPDPRNPAAERTARELLNKLDVHANVGEVVPGLPLLAMTAGSPTWASKPFIADLPGAETLIGLPLITATQWPRLARHLGLPRASAVVEQQVHATDSAWGRPLLNRATRARLLGLARRVPGAMRQAGRIASLRERQTQELVVELRISDRPPGTIRPPFHLYRRLDAGGRLLDADLFLTPAALDHRGALASALAAHCGAPEAGPEFALCLLDAAQAVEVTGLSDDEIASAEAALKRGRFAEDDPLDDEETDADEPTGTRGGKASTESGGRKASRRLPEPEDSSYENAEPQRRRQRRSSRSRKGKARKPRTTPARPVSSHQIVEDRSAEDQAIRHVVAYAERELGAKVADVQHLNRGWDLEFTHPDGTWQPVEVKGSKGRGPFVLTPNEVEQAGKHPNYAVYFVFGQRGREPRIARIERLRDHVREQDLVPMSWTLPTWADLPHEEILIKPLKR